MNIIFVVDGIMGGLVLCMNSCMYARMYVYLCMFVIFINDIDDGILSKISKFADDIKLCRAVGDDQEADILREDLRRMFRWSQDWQMLFNLEKCSVMHMGKR